MGMYNNGMLPNYGYGQQTQGYGMNQMQPIQTMQAQIPQIQNGGFVSVANENDARNYPVAPGNSVTFKDENSPFVYVKTMGFSQLDRPIFRKFRLIEESENTQPQNIENTANNVQNADYTTQEEMKHYMDELATLKKEINTLKSKVGNLTRRKEKRNDGEVME